MARPSWYLDRRPPDGIALEAVISGSARLDWLALVKTASRGG
jgi:hypothetical protein